MVLAGESHEVNSDQPYHLWSISYALGSEQTLNVCAEMLLERKIIKLYIMLQL